MTSTCTIEEKLLKKQASRWMVVTADPGGLQRRFRMGASVRSEEADFPDLSQLRDGDYRRSRLRALTTFVDTAVPALLLLTLMAGEQNSETVPDLKQLATMLSELQEGTEVGRDGPDPSAIGRLYRAVMNLKSGAS